MLRGDKVDAVLIAHRGSTHLRWLRLTPGQQGQEGEENASLRHGKGNSNAGKVNLMLKCLLRWRLGEATRIQRAWVRAGEALWGGVGGGKEGRDESGATG